VDLAWEAPDSPHSIRHYNLRLGGEVVDSTTDTEGTIELVDDDRLVSVAAVYDIHGDLIAGDLSESEFLRVEVPALQTVSPTSGWAGDTLRVTVQGSGLYLLDEHSELDFGPEITVSDLRVLDVDRAGATLSIGADAPVGPVTLWVTGAQGSFEFPAAFEVLDASEAPQIVSVKPGKLVQGDHADVVFEASEAFGSSVVVVDAGDHLVPGEVVMVDGNTVTVELTALGRSSVGEHVVILDDGFRTWTAPFEIVEYVTPTTTGCQHGGGSGSWLGLGLMALVMRRRGTPDAGPETRGATGR
jgi:hypothetical protein